MKKIIKKQILSLYYGMVNALQFRDPRIFFSCVITRRLPKSTKIPHPIGIIIGKENGVLIGERCVIMQNVTIGVKALEEKKGPTIGDDVFIGAGAVVVGNINVGNRSIIGANSVVTTDLSPGAVVKAMTTVRYAERKDQK